MTIPTEVIMRMATIGLSEEQAKTVADMLTAVETATVRTIDAERDRALEQRRKADADRQARKRERDMSRDITLRHSDRVLTGAGDARGEDKTSTSVIEPHHPKKDSAPASPSPRQHLETVLDAERAEAVIEHRKRIKFPLTSHAAKLLAKDFAKCSDPNVGADEMIRRGWRGFDPSWMDRGQQARAGPAGKVSPAEHFKNYASEINGQIRDDRGGSGDWDDAPGIPIRAIEHHG